jgi:hypothetical protein
VDGTAQAVRLADGRVLAAGDLRAATWNPKTGRWRPVESLNKTRTGARLVALRDGRALIVGGTNDSYQSYSSAYLFEPSSGTWTKTGLMDTARSQPAVVELADGRVLVAGGYFAHRPDGAMDSGIMLAVARTGGGTVPAPAPDDVDPGNLGRAMATAEVFDPKTGIWSSTGPMRYARYATAAVRLADGQVLIVGAPYGYSTGIDVDWHAVLTAELYDPATGRFSLTGSLPDLDPKAVARQGAPDWVVNSLEDSGGQFHGVGSLVALADGDAVLVGVTDWDHVSSFARSFRYDARRGTWSEIGDPWLTIERQKPPYPVWTSSAPNLTSAKVALLGDGRVLAAGGGESRVALAYVPRTGSWRALPRLPKKLDWRSAGAVTLADGSVLVVNSGNRPSYRFVPRR